MPTDDNSISREAGFAFAISFLTIVQRSLSSVPAGLEDLLVGEVVNEPLSIFDVSGDQLFYDFPIALNLRRLGSIRVAATKVLANPWIAIQQALPFDPAAALEQATRVVAAEMIGSSILDAKPVCYRYPNVGLLLKIKQEDGDEVIRIFDSENKNSALIEIAEGLLAGPDQIEGSGAFSILASLPEGGDPAAAFDRFDQLLNSIVSEASIGQQMDATIPKEQLPPSRLKANFVWNAKNRPEKSSASPEGKDTQKILSVADFPQEGTVFCVLACIQMIANSLGVTPLPTQSDMAQQLEQPPSVFKVDQGILPSNQTEAFRRIMPANFEITFDGEPGWSKFVDEIDANRCFKSGITGHARVAIGYATTTIGPVAGSAPMLQHSLWINDPANGTGMTFEPHEVVELDPADPSHIVSVTPRIPFKNNSVLVRRPGA